MNKKIIVSFVVIGLLASLFYGYYVVVSQVYPPDPLVFVLVFVLACFVFLGPIYYFMSKKERKKTPHNPNKHAHPIVRNCPNCNLLLPGHLVKCPNCGARLDGLNAPA